VASITGLNTNGINFSGLVTGINTDVLIEGLTRINQQRIDRLKERQAEVAAKQSAIATLQGHLYDLQSKTAALARSIGSIFDATISRSTDPDALSVATNAAAQPGSYILTVESIARAHMIASSGFNDPNVQLKQGTITLQVGNGPVTNINIDATNNTLQGIAKAINAANQDVQATVINDGSSEPYKLVITAKKTGESNTIQITSNLSIGDGAEIVLHERTLQQASDAVLKLGSGNNALIVRNPSNTLDRLIPGVTINLLKAEPGKIITLDILRDTKKIQDNIKNFVDTYNKLVDYINDQSRYNVETQKAGAFLGIREVQELVNDIASIILTINSTSNTGINRLSNIGITLTDYNKLNLDQNKLEQLLARGDSQTLSDLKKLFGTTGQSSNPAIEFVQGSPKTRVPASSYEVYVTSPATRGAITATTALGDTIIIQPPDNTLVVKLNNVALLNISIEPGTYTPEELARVLQMLINNHSNNSGNYVAVTLDDSQRLQITSQIYGSTSRVSIEGGSALTQLGFMSGASGQGSDVAGYFVANGTTETATGVGQLLTGVYGNVHTEGLQVKVTSPNPTSGELIVTSGIASLLNLALDKYINPIYGKIDNIQNNLKTQVSNINKEIDRQNILLQERKNELLRQFTAMESAVNNLRNLQGQLVALMPAFLQNGNRK